MALLLSIQQVSNALLTKILNYQQVIFLTSFFTIFTKAKKDLMSEEVEKNERGDLFSKSVRAGKRTYFFDVKSTKGSEYYLTITESKKRFGTDGKFFYEKHKIFLYKEDFEKFTEGFSEAIEYIKENSPLIENHASEHNSGSDVSFEDLGN